MVHWLELIGILPRGNHAALRFREPQYWSVDTVQDAVTFLRCLADLAPSGSVVYLEDSTDPVFGEFLERHQVAHPTPVRVATLFPKPDWYHVPATEDVLGTLADIVERSGSSFPVFHIALYREGRMLLEWLDAFHDDNMALSSTFTEEEVAGFSTALGVSYRWETVDQYTGGPDAA